MEKFMLTTFKTDSLPKIHIVDRYLDAVTSLGVKNDNEGLDFFLSDADKVELSLFPKDYIAFVPFSPVLILIALSISKENILPSPISPVFPELCIVFITLDIP